MSNIQQIKSQPLRQVPNVKTLLMNDQARDQLSAVAAKHMNPERMMRVVANAIRNTPKLQQCEPMSFLGALMHCASLGLEPNTPLGHAYLIPFENRRKGVTEVQVVIGYKGFIDLARRSGQLATIHGDIVYDDDELWSHEYGSDQHIRHRPGPRKGKRIGAYCYVKLNLGDGITAEGHRFMTMDEIISHRDQHSQGWKTAVRFNKTKESPWNPENPAFEAMAIKTVIRAMANRGELPMSIEFMSAMESDEQQADYRSFAMDPAAGVTIEGNASAEPDPEPESDPETDTKQEDPASKAEPEAKPARKPRAAPAKAKNENPDPEDSAPPQEEAGSDAPSPGLDLGDEPKKEAGARSPDREKFIRLVEMIENDLLDAPVSEIRSAYEAQIEQIGKQFPDLKERLEEAFSAAAAQE